VKQPRKQTKAPRRQQERVTKAPPRQPQPGTIPIWPGAAAAAFVGVIYLAAASGGTFHFRQSMFPHHVLTADAWLHGQLSVRQAALDQVRDLAEANRRPQVEAFYRERGTPLTEDEWNRIRRRLTLHDWAVVDGKYYTYWGPAPAALLLPYVAVAGVGASDRLAGAVIGALTVLLMYLTVREASRLGLLSTTTAAAAAVALLLGLGTVHFYLAVFSQVWFLSQIVAAFFLTLAIWAVLRSARAWWWAAIAGLAFGTAFLARNSELFTGPFFLFALVGMARPTPAGSWVRPLRLGVAFGGPVLAAVLLMLAFNHARFGNAFDTGLRSAVETGGNPSLKEDFREHGAFSLHYMPRNAYYYFANATLIQHTRSGAWTFDPYGNSMFFVTPALLYALRSYRRRNWLTVGAWVGSGVCLAMLLCYFATGWVTFGNRYLLDLLPLAMLLVAAGMNGRLTYVSATLILLSVLANAWGTYRFGFE
jgi:hypothetical protein